MTRGSNPPTPAQWNLHGWLAAYHASNTAPPTKNIKKEDDDMDDVMTGGWRFEGKEQPTTIRICPKCQGLGARRNDQISEPDRESWCEECKEGKPPPGHEPEGIRPPHVSKDQDATNLNKLSG